MQSSYLAPGHPQGLVGGTLAVKTYVSNGILLLHAIVHLNNLGDTRGRLFTFYSVNTVLLLLTCKYLASDWLTALSVTVANTIN